MPSMGRTPKYYPSTAFLPSVALGTLLATNSRRGRKIREFKEFREVREFKVFVVMIVLL